jgi:glycosyltransferase involved in cell wall biosynthesis
MNSSIPETGKKRIRKLNDVLFEKYVFKLVDGFFCISDYLYHFIRTNNPSIPLEKIPIISDFDRCVWIRENANNFEDYFLYCGSLDYLEVIRFILNSFSQINQTGKIFLYIVVNGAAKQFSQLYKDIATVHNNHLVKVFRNLTDAQLSYLYANAKALLAPIRPNQRDVARFPHKIAEYLSSSTPIITTAYGEIPNYFVDNYNAAIAKTYTIDSYAAKMILVISRPALASTIGINGFQTGLKNFDYRILSHKMEAFFDNL